MLGTDPATGKVVTLRNGPYGLYVQLGEAEGKEKPKRQSLPKGMTPDDVTLEKALALLALPRELGPHPEDGEPILAGIGRFGPYVKHGTKYKSHPGRRDVLEIGMNRAVALLAEAKAPGRGRAAAKPLRDVGNHPADEAPVELYEGRYGPYVKHGGINATVPRDLKPDELTLDQAVSLLAERAAKGGGQEAQGRAGQEGGTRQAGQRRRRRLPRRPTTRRPPRRRRRPSARPPSAKAQGQSADDAAAHRDRWLRAKSRPATNCWLSSARAPRPVGKREIARAFEPQGRPAHRAQGAAARPARCTATSPPTAPRPSRDPAALPDIAVLEIVRVDDDGHLLAVPRRHDEEQGRPAAPHRDRPAGEPRRRGPGRRRPRAGASLKRRGKTAYEARIIRRLGSGPRKVLGLFEEPRRPRRPRPGDPTDRKLKLSFDVTAGRQERRRAGRHRLGRADAAARSPRRGARGRARRAA